MLKLVFLLLLLTSIVVAQKCISDTGLTVDSTVDHFRCSQSMIPCAYDATNTLKCVNHRAGCNQMLSTDPSITTDLRRAMCPGAHPMAKSISAEWAAQQGISTSYWLWYSHERDLSKRLPWQYSDLSAAGVDLPRPLKPKFLASANELVMDCKMWANHYGLDVNTWCFKITPPDLTTYPHLAVYAEFMGGIKSSAQYIWSSPATGNWHSNPDLACNPNDISDESSYCIWYDGTNTGKPGSWSKPVTDLSFVRYDDTTVFPLVDRVWGGYACDLSDLSIYVADDYTCSWQFTGAAVSNCRDPATNKVVSSKCTRTPDCSGAWLTCSNAETRQSAYRDDDFEDRQVKVLANTGTTAGIYFRDEQTSSLWYPFNGADTICFLLECITPTSWSWGGNSWSTTGCGSKCCTLNAPPNTLPSTFCCADTVVNGIYRRPFLPAPAETTYTIDYILDNLAGNPTYVSTVQTTGMTKVCGTKVYKYETTANLDDLQTWARGALSLTTGGTWGDWANSAHDPKIYYVPTTSEYRFDVVSNTKAKSDQISFRMSDHFAGMFRYGGSYVDPNFPATLQDFFDKQEAHDLLAYGLANNQSGTAQSDLLNRAYPADQSYITDLDYEPLECDDSHTPNVFINSNSKLAIFIPASTRYYTYTKVTGPPVSFTKSTSSSVMGSSQGAVDVLPTSSDYTSMTSFRIPCRATSDPASNINFIDCAALPSSFSSTAGWPYASYTGSCTPYRT